MRPTIHFYLRVEKDRLLHDKSARIYMRVTMDNVKQPRFSMGYSIPLRKEFQHLKEEEIISFPTEKTTEHTLTRYELYHWDNVAQKPTKGCGNMHDVIRHMEREKEKANKVIDDHLMAGRTLTASSFSRYYKTSRENESLYDWCYNKLFGSMDHTLSTETLKSYETITGKLDNYAPKVRFQDIDVEFLDQYYNWMLKPKKLDENGKNTGGAGNNKRTAANNLKVIRSMFKLAHRHGYIPETLYPFKDFKIKERDKKLTTRDFLEIEEIFELEKLLFSYVPPSKENYWEVKPEEWEERNKKGIITPAEHRTLKRFLLACYTGLRFKDTESLDRDNHVFSTKVRQKNSDDKLHKYYIELFMHKTDEPVFIPLIDKAVTLIEVDGKGKIFEKLSNQKCNKFLKRLQQKAGLTKKITFHVARHSFATVAFEYDINEKVVQAILGHQNRKYTEIYTHLTKRRIILELEKLNQAHSVHGRKDALEELEVCHFDKIIPLLKKLDAKKLEKLKDLLEVLAAA